MEIKKRLELITLPIRATVLLFLFWAAYSLGYGEPQLQSRTESPQTGVVATYTRNGRPWRIFYDRNLDKKWDMWVDERGGPPLIVSIDDDGDGQPDRDQDEFGNPLSAWRAARIRGVKSLREFLSNPRQIGYTATALMLYVLLEFAIRSTTAERERS